MRIYAQDKSTNQTRYYKLDLTQKQARRVDNGALISCGLTAPDDVSSRWLKKHGAEVTQEEWNHSGCQSSCVLRGQENCSW